MQCLPTECSKKSLWSHQISNEQQVRQGFKVLPDRVLNKSDHLVKLSALSIWYFCIWIIALATHGNTTYSTA